MRTFPASALQRNSAEIQKAALKEPIFLTYHDKPRYVMMSLEEFARIQGEDIAADLADYPQAVATCIRELATAPGLVEPNSEPDLPAVDDEVLAAINRPYTRSIDVATLRNCLAGSEFDRWLVHVATFFTAIAPELVMRFADRHGISRSALANAYLEKMKRTGERNPDLEAQLVPMESASSLKRSTASLAFT